MSTLDTSKNILLSITSNQNPDNRNYLSRLFRRLASNAAIWGLVPYPSRPEGVSVLMRVKNEAEWIKPSIQSIKNLADEILIVDNGSTDGTYEILQQMAAAERDLIRLWLRPDLDLCTLSNFALSHARFRWVFRWDGDMVAHTTGKHTIFNLRDRILSLDPRCYYLIYLRHINLSGDLFHQNANEMVHIEEYIHTYSDAALYIHPGRFEAIKVPRYYRVLFWYEPYSFHVNVKPANRMLLRYFWEDWMGLKDYQRFPTLEDYVNEKIESEFGTDSWEKAQRICLQRIWREHIRYNSEVFGPYPKLLEPYLNKPKYLLKYQNNKIVGRVES